MTALARILVVDDSPSVRAAATALLEREGFEVHTSDSGESGFERSIGENFDLIVSDVTMGALSGFQLTRLLRADAATHTLPIVLLTAREERRSKFWGRSAGADAYVSKEAMQTELVSTVQQLLAEAQPRGPVREARAGRRSASALERLSRVLEQSLFQAVLAAEARRLMQHIDDRRNFSREALAIAADVVDFAYVVLRLDGPFGPSHALQAQRAWPANAEPDVWAAIGIDASAREQTIVHGALNTSDLHSRVDPGEGARFPLVAGDEVLGEMRVYNGNRRLSADDEATCAILASEMAIVAKCMFLMEEAQRLAVTDELTSLFNRRRGNEILEHETLRATRLRTPLTVALCDIDRFKQVNDVFGHRMGDTVLQIVAGTLKRSVRAMDSVCRWGGEEFLLVLPGVTPLQARALAGRIRRAVSALPAIAGGPENVTISIGVASLEGRADSSALVEAADEALYRAKRAGRNRVELALPATTKASE